jgi:UDP-glucose 4-epimerase
MAKCLVLGANGFIGSHLVDSLVTAGHTVRAFDRFSSGTKRYSDSENIEQWVGDYLNRDDLSRALKGMEYVFHFISTTTPVTAENDPIIDIETNIQMSVELFQLCVQAKVKRVLFASTGGAIYGTSIDKKTVAHNEKDPTLPISPYAIGKLTIENYLRYFSTKFKLDYISFRIANPYGDRQPLQSKQGVIPIFLEKVHTNQPITVFGNGSMVRDYIYVKDVTDMVTAAFQGPHRYDVYNIGSGQGNTLNEVIECIKDVTGKKVEIHREAVPATFVDKVILDTDRYRSEFHIEPETSLLDGVRATYEHIIGSEKE